MPGKEYVQVIHRDTGAVLIKSAHWCRRYLCRLFGLQFRRRLSPGEALILVESEISVAASSIHMFFVFFPIAVVWINKKGQVTSTQLALPWRPYYASPTPAAYVLETSPDFLEKINIGDEVDFVPIN